MDSRRKEKCWHNMSRQSYMNLCNRQFYSAAAASNNQLYDLVNFIQHDLRKVRYVK